MCQVAGVVLFRFKQDITTQLLMEIDDLSLSQYFKYNDVVLYKCSYTCSSLNSVKTT